jgi:hypothetical protein
MSKKKKPAPISVSLDKKPQKKEAAPVAPPMPVAQGINDISPITAKQIQRAENAIDNLRQEVNELRSKPPKVKVEAAAPTIVLPERPRISKVTIKYDALGYPSELIPQYSKLTV